MISRLTATLQRQPLRAKLGTIPRDTRATPSPKVRLSSHFLSQLRFYGCRPPWPVRQRRRGPTAKRIRRDQRDRRVDGPVQQILSPPRNAITFPVGTGCQPSSRVKGSVATAATRCMPFEFCAKRIVNSSLLRHSVCETHSRSM